MRKVVRFETRDRKHRKVSCQRCGRAFNPNQGCRYCRTLDLLGANPSSAMQGTRSLYRPTPGEQYYLDQEGDGQMSQVKEYVVSFNEVNVGAADAHEAHRKAKKLLRLGFVEPEHIQEMTDHRDDSNG